MLPPAVRLSSFDRRQASSAHPALVDEALNRRDVLLRPHALRPARGVPHGPEVLVELVRAPVDPAEAERDLDGVGGGDGPDARALLCELEEDARGGQVLAREVHLELALGGEVVGWEVVCSGLA